MKMGLTKITIQERMNTFAEQVEDFRERKLADAKKL